MKAYTIDGLIFPWQADYWSGTLSTREAQRGYRVIGGDRGDVRFTGYDVDDAGTELAGVTLHSALDLTPDEALEVAMDIVAQAYQSIGTECVEHS